MSQHITKDKEGHLKIQNPIHQEYRRRLNMHATNIRASKIHEPRSERRKSTIKAEDSTLLSQQLLKQTENQRDKF